MKSNFRSNCPVTCAIDIVGDKWMLVIVKQMLLEGKRTFKDFIDSEEGIATNILSSKLKKLERLNLVIKSEFPNNKRMSYYRLTDKGLSLTSIIVELAIWSDENLRTDNPNILKSEELSKMKTEKQKFIKTLIEKYKNSLI